MPRQKKEFHLNPRECPNGKFYTKFENVYIGTLTKEQLEVVQKEIELFKDKLTSKELLKHFQELFVDKEKGDAISKGMKGKEVKQYNKKLEIGVIAKNKELAKHFQCTEDEMLTTLINDKYNELF